MRTTIDLRARKIVVVGAAGFLGRACVGALAAAGAEVVGVDVNAVEVAGAASWEACDVLADGVPAAVLAGADAVIHLAWRNVPGSGDRDMHHDVASNVACAVRVFQQAARAGVRRILYASSGGTIYGTAPTPWREDMAMAPIGGYGAGKAAAELYLGAIGHAYGVQTCALRIANPYGPFQYPDRGQGFIATAIARTLRREPIEIFGSMALGRDYVFVSDVADAMARACADESRSLVLNVGSGVERTLAELVERIFAAVGHETEIRFTPRRSMDVPHMALDIARIGATLGWRPSISIDDGLRASVAWISALPGS